LAGRTQKTILQFIHGWLPVNGHPGVGKLGNARLCPYCTSAEETQDHFLSCCHITPTHQRRQLYLRIQTHLKKHRTHQELTKTILAGLEGQLLTPTNAHILSLHAAQQQIGWPHLMKGNLSMSWVRIYDTLHATNCGEQWCISLLKVIWTGIYELWKSRCEHVHGATQSQRRTQLLNDLTPRITTLYESKHQLLHIDQMFFSRPMELILQLPDNRLTTWVYKAERIINRPVCEQRVKLINNVQHSEHIFRFLLHQHPLQKQNAFDDDRQQKLHRNDPWLQSLLFSLQLLNYRVHTCTGKIHIDSHSPILPTPSSLNPVLVPVSVPLHPPILPHFFTPNRRIQVLTIKLKSLLKGAIFTPGISHIAASFFFS
jgi:hypothetical protein